MIQLYPDYKSTQIWNMLKHDCSLPNRVYDTDEILEEVNSTELIWTNRKGERTNLMKKSFFNLLKKIKDKLI
jgi:hypothetical protein